MQRFSGADALRAGAFDFGAKLAPLELEPRCGRNRALAL
jgi:hypothetical protein